MSKHEAIKREIVKLLFHYEPVGNGIYKAVLPEVREKPSVDEVVENIMRITNA